MLRRKEGESPVKTHRALLLLAACLASSATIAESNDILKTLDEAQRLWESSHPRNYSYTISWSYAFTGPTYKVTVRGDTCTARVKRHVLAKWESISCEGGQVRVTDLFAQLREEAQSCPADVQLDVDKKYGFISSVSFYPRTELSDVFWSAGISRFRAH
jgi:hypothetical protein